MTDIIIKNLRNLSDSKFFRFSLSCAECGKAWYSTPIPFSKANKAPASDSKVIVYHALYRREMEQAAAKAVTEAKRFFNLCPVCKGLVCDDCFMICDDIDMCVSCAEELGETGEIVSAEYSAN